MLAKVAADANLIGLLNTVAGGAVCAALAAADVVDEFSCMFQLQARRFLAGG